MDRLFVLLCLLPLTACITAREDPGVVAAKLEAQDDASCRKLMVDRRTPTDPQAYGQCRQNLLVYRQEAAAQEARQDAQRDRFGAALQEAGAALGNIGR